MANVLTPGSAGLPAPSPSDQQAVPPQAAPAGNGLSGAGNGLSGPPPGPSDMQQHYSSAEEVASVKFGRLKAAKAKMDGTLKEFEKLTAYGDTVSMDDLMETASGIVALGVPAVAVASMLASVPEQPSQLESWVQEQISNIQPKAAQLDAAFQNARYDLGLSAMKSIMAASAEDHFSKQNLAAMRPQGRA